MRRGFECPLKARRCFRLVVRQRPDCIEHLRAKTPDGKEHRVRAKQYVLACGSIHNARLLLASNSRAPRGVGNNNDLVGRYFMERFEVPSTAQLRVTLDRDPVALL